MRDGFSLGFEHLVASLLSLAQAASSVTSVT